MLRPDLRTKRPQRRLNTHSLFRRTGTIKYATAAVEATHCGPPSSELSAEGALHITGRLERLRAPLSIAEQVVPAMTIHSLRHHKPSRFAEPLRASAAQPNARHCGYL
jgi:hypothetical protein